MNRRKRRDWKRIVRMLAGKLPEKSGGDPVGVKTDLTGKASSRHDATSKSQSGAT